MQELQHRIIFLNSTPTLLLNVCIENEPNTLNIRNTYGKPFSIGIGISVNILFDS